MSKIIMRPPRVWGFIPDFLDEDDPRGAREQFNERYRGGWHPMAGCSFDLPTLTLRYPGDPPFRPLSMLFFRNELLLLYEGSFVLVVLKDGAWEIARMD